MSFSLLYAFRCSAASLRCSFQSSKTSLATATFSAATSLATSKPTCVLSAAFCKPLRKDKRVIRIPKANNKNTSKMIAPSSPNRVRRNVAIAPPTTPPWSANCVVINSCPSGTRHNGTRASKNRKNKVITTPRLVTEINVPLYNNRQPIQNTPRQGIIPPRPKP